MKIGINVLLWTADLQFDAHEALLEKIRNIGFEVFETSVGNMSARDVERFAKKAAQLGLEPQCTELFYASEADVISADKALRDNAVARIKSSILKARDMGSTLLSGPFFQGLCGSTDVGPTGDEWKWAVECLRECAEAGKKSGIRLAGEPLNRFEMHIVNTISDTAKMCDDIGMDNFGILADTHHSNIEELDMVDSYVRNIKKIFNVHISESNRGIPGSGRGIPPELFAALKDNGYQGNLVIEAFNANVPETLKFLRIWKPLAKTTDEIAVKGFEYIQKNLKEIGAL